MNQIGRRPEVNLPNSDDIAKSAFAHARGFVQFGVGRGSVGTATRKKVKERKRTAARIELAPDCPSGQAGTRPADCVRIGIAVDLLSVCQNLTCLRQPC